MRTLITYTGNGGYPHDREAAAKVFEVGKQYEVIDGHVGSCHTSLKLKDVEGSWNSALFDCDLSKLERDGVIQTYTSRYL